MAALIRQDLVVDGPLWNAAVLLKRDRAYRQLEGDGLDRSFIAAHYDAFQRQHGQRLHDRKLREEAGRCTLVRWTDGGGLVGYACVQPANLLGSADHPILSVFDLCLRIAATAEQCGGIVTGLQEMAAERGARFFEVTSIGRETAARFWEACEELGGYCVSKTYRFRGGA